MNLPKFLLGDNTDHMDAIFVVHTEFPRFVINLVDDEIEWFEDLQSDDADELAEIVAGLIEEATAFYDQEMERYESE